MAGHRGIVFAYDEAQNLADHAQKEQFPLSLLLDTFQSLQKKGLPGAPGVGRLAHAVPEAGAGPNVLRANVPLDIPEPAFGEREPGGDPETDRGQRRRAAQCRVRRNGHTPVRRLPYFIQFICREVYDAFIRRLDKGEQASVPVADIERKLDNDFFAGRWAKTTDRQRDLLSVIAQLESRDEEFTVREIVEKARELSSKGFSSSHTSQMLAALSTQGLVFKNRHGRYLFAVQLLAGYIRRQHPVA